MSRLKGFKIRHINIDPGLVLSPMSGVTTSAFRRLIKELNPGAVGLMVTEFIAAEALTRNVRRSLDMMRFREEERPVSVQIFGYDIKRMRDAALMVQDSGADIVDINCGCPAPKVVRKGGGCELMRQPLHLSKIIGEVRNAISIPLTIKIRSGWDNSSLNALEIALMAEEQGVEGLAIHGRTRAQLYRGEADWELVEQVASRLKIPVFGSGDVACHASAMSKLTANVAGLFVGRASLNNPYVFSDILHGRSTNLRKDVKLVFKVLDRYVALLKEDFPAQACVGKLKQLATQVCRGFPWRKDILSALTLDKQLEILQRAQDDEQGTYQPIVDQWIGANALI